MPKTFDEVLDDVYELSPEDFEKLKEVLVGPPPTLHPAWGPELRRRAAELDSGEVKGVPLAEFRENLDKHMAALEAKYGQR